MTPATPRGELLLRELPGRTAYRRGLRLQKSLARARIEGREERDWLLLVEHDPVLTLGRNADLAHLTTDRESLEARGIECVEISRGGDVTYHGPGQLVGYPVLDLRRHRRDLHWYVRTLEAALIAALGELGLPAFAVPDHTGVWVGERPAGEDEDTAGREPVPDRAGSDEGEAIAAAILAGRVRKIASIGVHVSRWITWHGFALNLTREPLENFGLIVPCGIPGVRMTCLEAEGVGAGRARVREAIAAGFASAFDLRVRAARADELPSPTDAGPERSPASATSATAEGSA